MAMLDLMGRAEILGQWPSCSNGRGDGEGDLWFFLCGCWRISTACLWLSAPALWLDLGSFFPPTSSSKPGLALPIPLALEEIQSPPSRSPSNPSVAITRMECFRHPQSTVCSTPSPLSQPKDGVGGGWKGAEACPRKPPGQMLSSAGRFRGG